MELRKIPGCVWRAAAIPISKRKSQEPFQKPIYNFTPIRNFGAFAA
jgi:hypothetical protein